MNWKLIFILLAPFDRLRASGKKYFSTARPDLSINSRLKAPSKAAHPEPVEGVEGYGRIQALLTMLFIISISLPLLTRVGCIDNSFHLKKWPDFKQYHYVQCSCPCSEFAHVAERDKCLKCGHYHAPQPKILITKNGVIHE